MGNPISHSIHKGLNFPPTWDASVGVFLFASLGEFCSFALCAGGVGHIWRPTIVSKFGNLLLSHADFGVIVAAIAELARGVGHIATAPAMFNPCFPAITLGLLWLAPPLTMLQVGVGK